MEANVLVEIGKKVANRAAPRTGMEMGPAMGPVSLAAAGSAVGVELRVGPDESESDPWRAGRSSRAGPGSSGTGARGPTPGGAAGP